MMFHFKNTFFEVNGTVVAPVVDTKSPDIFASATPHHNPHHHQQLRNPSASPPNKPHIYNNGVLADQVCLLSQENMVSNFMPIEHEW